MTSEPLNGLHVAIIMDGNGRWAARRGLPRVAGHRAGVAALRRVVERAPDGASAASRSMRFLPTTGAGRLPRSRASSGCCELSCALRRNGSGSVACGCRSSVGAIDWQNLCCVRSRKPKAQPLRDIVCICALPSITRRAMRSRLRLPARWPRISTKGRPRPIRSTLLKKAMTARERRRRSVDSHRRRKAPFGLLAVGVRLC